MGSLHERLTALTRAGVVVTATVMPLYLVRFKVGPVPTTLLEVVLLVTVTLYLAAVIVGRGPLPGRTPYEIPIALFLVAGLIGIFVASDHRGALGIYRAYLVEPVLLFYVSLAVFGRGKRVEAIFVPVAIATMLYCAVDVVFFSRAAVEGRLIPGNVAAAFGLDPNYIALYLEPLIGFAAGFAWFGTGRQRWLAVVALLFMLPTEVATFSRGGLVTLVALAALAVVTLGSWRVRAAIAVAALAGAIAVLNLPLLGIRIRQALTLSTNTIVNRLRIWAATARMAHDHPIFGAGLNSYQKVMAPYRAGDPYAVPEPHPHNILLTSWTELGILGMIAFAWILGSLLVRPWLAFGQSRGFHRAVLWGTGAAFLMIAVHGLVDSPYWKNDLSVEFWLLAAMQILSIRATRSGLTS